MRIRCRIGWHSWTKWIKTMISNGDHKWHAQKRECTACGYQQYENL